MELNLLRKTTGKTWIRCKKVLNILGVPRENHHHFVLVFRVGEVAQKGLESFFLEIVSTAGTRVETVRFVDEEHPSSCLIHLCLDQGCRLTNISSDKLIRFALDHLTITEQPQTLEYLTESSCNYCLAGTRISSEGVVFETLFFRILASIQCSLDLILEFPHNLLLVCSRSIVNEYGSVNL